MNNQALIHGAILLASPSIFTESDSHCFCPEETEAQETKNLVGLPLADLLVLNFKKSTDRMINLEFSTDIYSPKAALPIAAESL